MFSTRTLVKLSIIDGLVQIACLFFLFLFIFGTSLAQAQDRKISLEVGKSLVLPVTEALEAVTIGDDIIADVSAAPDDTVFLFGKTVGETNLILTTLSGANISFDVVVTHNMSELQRALNERFPAETINLKSARGTLLISGVVASEATRQAVVSTVQGAIVSGEVVDRLTVTKTNIVRLEVRVLEVNRNRAQTFGIDWNLAIANNGFFLSSSNQGQFQFGFDSNNGPSNNVSFGATVDLLISNGIATIVQETTLAAVSGESANLRIGTEFPVPRLDSRVEDAQSSNVSIDYRFVGTDLSFTPTFGNSDKLRLVVDTTVSELQASVTTINGNNFPNNSTRSFATTVDLLDRQPFAIAGLSRDVTNSVLRDSTGTVASDIVNTVFGADRSNGTQQELVVIITPILSDAAEDVINPRLLRPTSNLEFILSRGTEPADGQIATLAERGGASQPGFKY